MQYVPYKGAAPALQSVMTGEAQYLFNNIGTSQSFVLAGKLRGFAVTGEKRSPALPDVPTTAEAGLPDYVASGIFSMLAPAGTPKEVIDKINAEMMAASKDPTVQSRFRDQGAEPTVTTPEELAKIVKEDNAKWIGIIQKAGMQPQ